MQVWKTTRFEIALTQPRVMGIVNLTPDSFSDGGLFLDPSKAIEQARRLLRVALAACLEGRSLKTRKVARSLFQLRQSV